MVKIKQDLHWVKQEAKRCLYCLDAPCTKGCPTSIDIPQFIRHLRYGNVQSAKDEIMTANPLGTICGTLCPSEKFCEKECVLNSELNPIHIRDLQKFACENAEYKLPSKVKKNDKKIAVIGAGPASLGCATKLVLMGYDVDIFEKGDTAGGIVESEIPSYRIEKNIIEDNINELLDSRISIYYNHEVKKEELQKYMDEYDAVFLGIGLNEERNIGIEVNSNNGVFGSSEFLKGIKSGKLTPPKGTVIVIGGGDSAIDVATKSILNGSDKAIIAYRRTRKEMPATDEELFHGVDQGIELMYLVSPVAVKEHNGGLEVTFIRNRLTHEVDGRQGYEEIKGSEFTISANAIVFSVGKLSDFSVDKKLESGTLRLEGTNCFTGGDYLNSGGTIVQAVEDGKNAAYEINKYLSETVIELT